MNKRRKLSKMNVKKQHLAYGAITLVALFSCILAVTVIFKSSQVTTESLSKADKVRVAKKSKMNKATSKSKVEGVKQAPKPSSQSTEANSQQQVTASEEAAVEQAVVTEIPLLPVKHNKLMLLLRQLIDLLNTSRVAKY